MKLSRLPAIPTMFALAVPAVVALMAVGAFADSSPSPAAGAGALPGDPNHGQQLFGQTCGVCHGADATGGTGPSLHPITKLSGVAQPLDPAYLINTISNGRAPSDGFGQMPAKGGNSSLTEQDVKDIAAYIIQLNQQTGPSPYDQETLPKMTMLWVAVGILGMVVMTYLLAQYNMRWIARRAKK